MPGRNLRFLRQLLGVRPEDFRPSQSHNPVTETGFWDCVDNPLSFNSSRIASRGRRSLVPGRRFRGGQTKHIADSGDQLAVGRS